MGIPGDIPGIAAQLRGSRDWRDIYRHVRKLVTSSPGAAVELAAALDADLAERGHDLAVWSVRDSLLGLVAGVPGAPASLVATRLGAHPAPGAAAPDVARQLAAMQVAGTRPAAQLTALLRKEPLTSDPEFGLLLLHELVLRGDDVSEVAAPFVDWAASTDHPLRELPTALTEIEHGLTNYLPRYPDTQRRNPPWPELIGPERVPLGGLIGGVARRTIGPPRHAAAAFDGWVRDSNGQVDITTFPLGPNFAAAAGKPPALRADRPAHRASVAEVCARLFAAACTGGAYSRGVGGAFARLTMWESLAGFVGLDWPAAVPEVQAAAKTARWIALDVSDEWFYDVCWDEWLIAEVDGQLTVVAATDTD